VHYSNSIARVRGTHAESSMENGEIWTDTTFRVLSQNKAISLRKSSFVSQAENSSTCTLASKARPNFVPAKRSICFSPRVPAANPDRRLGPGHFPHPSRSPLRRRNRHPGFRRIPVFDPASNSFTKTGVKNLALDAFEQRLRRELARETK